MYRKTGLQQKKIMLSPDSWSVKSCRFAGCACDKTKVIKTLFNIINVPCMQPKLINRINQTMRSIYHFRLMRCSHHFHLHSELHFQLHFDLQPRIRCFIAKTLYVITFFNLDIKIINVYLMNPLILLTV